MVIGVPKRPIMNELLIILKSGWDFLMLVITVLEIQLGGDAKEGQGQRTLCVLSGFYPSYRCKVTLQIGAPH